MKEVAAREQVAFDPGGGSSGAIGFSIPDQKTRCGVDRPATEEVQNHPWCRFAPVACPAIFGKLTIGMKRAITNVVEMGSRLCKLRRYLRMECVHIVLRIEPARDPGLVGDDKHEATRVVEQFDRRLSTVDPTKSRI